MPGPEKVYPDFRALLTRNLNLSTPLLSRFRSKVLPFVSTQEFARNRSRRRLLSRLAQCSPALRGSAHGHESVLGF